ncbi:endonuclease YncB(thermonuclease family) [Dysgonomonas hofstadii]|uniref:Endonuclease YncB(Thermonuclease family) n=1 Tax=Dysgonomonas hofstadii TaxID=637886 RepID=A0A840CPE2_9BACT|nr:thermonuclease family protein [Dysgonomonas hofstadii]MBB4036549.1 endonuclease YncB(thermonuclease family) [Dysgonomonas hofstadii]
MRYIIILLSFLSISLYSQNTIRGKVVKISDGDTVVLRDSTNTQHRIRLDGIDCPERGQAFGNVATNFTRGICAGKDIIVDIIGYDRYKRILGVVWVEDVNLNEELLKAGLAWRYKYNKSEEYHRLEQEARKNRKGLWVDKEPIAPWDFRKKGQNTISVGVSYVYKAKSNIYHRRKDCPELTKYKSDINKIDIKEAKRNNLYPCTMCSK